MFIQFSSGGELLYNNNNNNNTGIIFPPSSSNFSFPFITSTVSNSAFRIQQRSNTDSTVATAVIMPTATEKQRQRRLLQQQQQQQQQQQRRRLVAKDDRCCRVLYTITSLAEYNTGSRATTKGSDRLLETLIPVVSEGVRSMQQVGYHVDVFLVSHYKLLPERKQLIQDSLPNNVSFRYWDNAMPLGYDTGKYKEYDGSSKIEERSISLARQHRFVVRDHLLEYDVFLNFEDDMLVTGDLVQHYVRVSKEIEQLQAAAPEDLPDNHNNSIGNGNNPTASKATTTTYSGPMTKGQLRRIIPGFIRVEVLLDPNTTASDSTKGSPVPVDFVFDNDSSSKSNSTIDPASCCHVSTERSSSKRPSHPKPEHLLLWETDIQALGVRKMPQQQQQQQQPDTLLDWVALLRGPTYNKDDPPNTIISDYWAGTDGRYFTGRRPGGNSRNLINNMGGWMATRQQIWNWHTQICPGGFLPPYEAPHYRFDGLDLRDVEWWSGGMHLVTKRHACNMQRIVSLKPDHFGKHLIYHTANNKQTQHGLKRFTRAQDLWGQLNTVRKNAQAAMPKLIL